MPGLTATFQASKASPTYNKLTPKIVIFQNRRKLHSLEVTIFSEFEKE